MSYLLSYLGDRLVNRVSCYRLPSHVFSGLFASLNRSVYRGYNACLTRRMASTSTAGDIDPRPVFFFDIDNCVCIWETLIEDRDTDEWRSYILKVQHPAEQARRPLTEAYSTQHPWGDGEADK